MHIRSVEDFIDVFLVLVPPLFVGHTLLTSVGVTVTNSAHNWGYTGQLLGQGDPGIIILIFGLYFICHGFHSVVNKLTIVAAFQVLHHCLLKI